jgi:DMSO/TMAO reductase YedYZ molybdopterin-dependent catalytic subunit
MRTARLRVAALAILALAGLPTIATPTRAQSFANSAFESTWARTDKLVADGSVKRSYYWGPVPGATVSESYVEGVDGKRVVQYFDKSRMEINNPSGDPNSPFYVTNGLLTVELITGQMQIGNNSFAERYPAEIPLASDTDDTNAPTYATFGKLMGKAANSTGKIASNRIDRAGNVSPYTVSGQNAQQTIAYYEPSTGHNIPRVFWDFLNASGPVFLKGNTSQARLSDPWFYAAGLPISEPYWAKVKINGQANVDVLVQAYQRRVLTYVPTFPAGFQVQMGNIGQHYYDWRYKDAGRPGSGSPTTPTPGIYTGSITVTGAVTRTLTLNQAALAAHSQHTVSVTFRTASGSTESHTYKGPLLLELLQEAGGNGKSGRDLPVRYIVATGQGGQKSILSWGEIDPIFAGTQAIVAYQEDGANLSDLLGPARLVVPSDKMNTRSLYALTKLEVRTVPAASTTGSVLKVTGAVAHPLSLSVADLAARNPQAVKVQYQAGGSSVSETYTGVSLLRLLNEAGVQGDTQNKVIVAGEADGRQAVFSWGEIDPNLAGVNVMAANTVDGVTLGTPRMVVPSDARGGRYLPYVNSLDVRDVIP